MPDRPRKSENSELEKYSALSAITQVGAGFTAIHLEMIADLMSPVDGSQLSAAG